MMPNSVTVSPLPANPVAASHIGGKSDSDLHFNQMEVLSGGEQQGTDIFDGTAQWSSNLNGSSLTFTVAAGRTLAVGRVLLVSVGFTNPLASQATPRHVRLEAVVEGGQLAFGEKATYDDTSIFAYAGATAVSGVKRESLFVGIRDGRPVIMRPACICFCMT